MNTEIRFGILKNETNDLVQNWINACEKYNYSYVIVDSIKNDWLKQIEVKQLTHFLLCPPGLQSHFKTLYDERVYILNKVLKCYVYPSYEELILHENKRFLSFFLEARHIPHPHTDVFYRKSEALAFCDHCDFPVVGKMNIGASGSGVKIIKTKKELTDYIQKSFAEGIRSKVGPNLKTGKYLRRFAYVVRNPSHLFERLKKYKAVYAESQKGFVLLQQYIPHQHEWRIVKIGNSFFGHKKIKMGEKASGSKGIDYEIPPDNLLDFVQRICASNDFKCMAVDCFEDGHGGYLVNEMQTVFGHVQDYICEKDGAPGRLITKNGSWEFEDGNFNSNLSYDLRFENVLEDIR